MASSWIIARGEGPSRRFRVLYRLGGRESKQHYAGSFRTKAEALERRRWIDGELAGLRVPDLSVLKVEPVKAPTVAEAAARWQESRVDVAPSTRLQHRSAVRAAILILGDKRVDAVTTADVADMVATLSAKGRKRETVRKSVLALAMVLDHADIAPNPARDKVQVRLPHGDHVEIQPPTADHVLAVHALLPARLQAAAPRPRRDRDAPR